MALTGEEIAQLSCEMIAYSGAAKSSYLEALEYAKAGAFDKTEKALEEGRAHQQSAHDIHFNLVREEISSPSGLLTRLLLVHAEDQMAAAETILILSEQLIEVHRRLA